jgi:hypothetical protein
VSLVLSQVWSTSREPLCVSAIYPTLHSITALKAGFCCVYVSFIAQNSLQLLNAGKCWLGAEWLWLLIVVQARSEGGQSRCRYLSNLLFLPLPRAQFFIFVPLTWVRRIASFGPAVLVADALILLGLVGIIAYSIHVREKSGWETPL